MRIQLTPRKLEYLDTMHRLGRGWHRVDLVGALLDVGNGDAAGWIVLVCKGHKDAIAQLESLGF